MLIDAGGQDYEKPRDFRNLPRSIHGVEGIGWKSQLARSGVFLWRRLLPDISGGLRADERLNTLRILSESAVWRCADRSGRADCGCSRSTF